MYKKETKTEKEGKVVKIAVFNIPQISDEHWKQLSYQNYLERTAKERQH